MAEQDKTNHWAALASELGPQPAAEESSPRATEPSKAAPPPVRAERAAHRAPRRATPNWDALAGDLGLAPAPAPAPAPARAGSARNFCSLAAADALPDTAARFVGPTAAACQGAQPGPGKRASASRIRAARH